MGYFANRHTRKHLMSPAISSFKATTPLLLTAGAKLCLVRWKLLLDTFQEQSIRPPSASRSSGSRHRPLRPAPWLMMTPVIGFTLRNKRVKKRSYKKGRERRDAPAPRRHVSTEMLRLIRRGAGLLRVRLIEFVRLFLLSDPSFCLLQRWLDPPPD